MKDANRIRWPSLIFWAIAFLVCVSLIATRRWVRAAIDGDIEFSAIEGSSVPSAIGSLLAGNVSEEIGDAVFLNDVQLQAGPKPNLFVVSGAKGVRMLASLEGARQFQAVPANVDIKGTIRRLPALGVLRKVWKLSKEDITLYGKQRVYLAADHVEEQNRKTTDE